MAPNPYKVLHFTAQYTIDGETHTQKMAYSTADVIKTLERRLNTAFPNAVSVTIVQDEPPAGPAAPAAPSRASK